MRYIVIDVEFNGQNYFMLKPQEIIELAAIILDENLKIVSQFQSFVKPIYGVNKFALKYTGIKQASIESANSFDIAIKKFLKLLKKDDILVFWGSDDIYKLYEDCKRFNIRKTWLNRSIDILLQFPLRHNGRGQMNLREACEFFGIEWSGNEHRAYSDAFHTAKLFIKTIKMYDLSNFHDINWNPASGIAKRTIKDYINRQLSLGEFPSCSKFFDSQVFHKLLTMYKYNKSDLKQIEKYFNKLNFQVIRASLKNLQDTENENHIAK